MVKKSLIFILIFVVGIAISAGGFYVFGKVRNKPTEAPKIVFSPRPEPSTLPANEFSFWLGYWDEDRALSSLTKHANDIKSISPMWYQLEKDGSISKFPDAVKTEEIKNAAKSKKIRILPTLTNEFDPDKISALLDSEEMQTKNIAFLIKEAEEHGYAGWDIDLEEMYEGDKTGFNDFMEMLSDALHEKNLLLSITVQAKSNLPTDRDALKAQDWPTLTKHADFIRVMAYDFHDSKSEAGAITPISDLDRVLKYAVSVVPKEKLVVGLPTYGYDWVGSKGVDVQFEDANKILTENRGTLKRDEFSKELVGTYSLAGKKHEIWFQDAQSITAKINVARSYGLNQFAFWRLGGDDEAMWPSSK